MTNRDAEMCIPLPFAAKECIELVSGRTRKNRKRKTVRKAERHVKAHCGKSHRETDQRSMKVQGLKEEKKWEKRQLRKKMQDRQKNKKIR